MKEFLYFTRSERRGIIVLAILVLLVFLSGYVYRYWLDNRPVTEEELREQTRMMKEYEEFMAILTEIEAEEKPYPHHTQSSPGTPRPLTPDPFNPNTADSATFVRMGLPRWVARNIVKYRSRGGRFRKPEDFRKIYGLTEEQYNVLLPYIKITTTAPLNPPKGRTPDTSTIISPLTNGEGQGERLEGAKYPLGTTIDLNTADTTELKRIPGIGSGIARMITNHRQRLGGYYCIEQLGELRLKYEQLRPWFTIDTTQIQRINVNRSGVEQLRRHPYINFYQARAIVEYRKMNGDLRNLRPFILYEEFTPEDLDRLTHYLTFE